MVLHVETNVVEHATILCDELPIRLEHLPQRLAVPRFSAGGAAPAAAGRRLGPLSLRELELVAIQEALDRHQGNKVKVAEELGVSLKTLYNKLHQMAGLEKTA